MIAVCKGILNIFYILIITVAEYGIFFYKLHNIYYKMLSDIFIIQFNKWYIDK